MKITAAAVLVFLCLFAGSVAAQRGNGMEQYRLPQGERQLAFAWAGPEAIVFLVDTNKGFDLRRLDLNLNEISEPLIPPQLERLYWADNESYELEFSFNNQGTVLAIVKRFAGPLKQNDLLVFAVDEINTVWVSTRSIPAMFWIDHITWDTSGQSLYLSAEPYSKVEQQFSVGVFNVEDKSFHGVASKAQVDLIEGLAYLPQREMLALRAKGIVGAFPLQSAALLLNPLDGAQQVLHSQADALELWTTTNGTLLLMNCASDGDLAANGHWMFGPADAALRPATLELDASNRRVDFSSDGKWMAVLSSAGGSDEPHLAVQRVSDGLSLVSDEPCSDFRFAPDNSQICAAAPDGRALYVYQLPAN